jgi:hypothetical protein
MPIISTAQPLSAKYICIMRIIMYSEVSIGTHNVNVKFIYVCKKNKNKNKNKNIYFPQFAIQ